MNSPAPQAATQPYIHTVTLGSTGPTIVMLHGWGRSLDALRPLGELLANQYRIVLVDLPGFGLSPIPHEASNEGGGWDTLQYAERVKQLIDQLSIPACILIGHSFGGRLAVQLAARYPQVVRGLVLIGSHGLSRERPLLEEIRLRTIRALVAGAKKVDGLFGTRLFAHYFSPKFGSADYIAAGELRKTLVKTVNEDLRAEAGEIKAPTLLLWGAKDTATPLDLAHKYHGLIADSELHVFPNKGHEPFADVGAHLCATYIERFLNKRGLFQ